MEIKISIHIGGEYKGSKAVQTPCFIGRSKEAGMPIAHPSVSRKHCELYVEADQLFLRDNGSLNGTLLRGEFVESPVALRPGDEFVIGELQLRVEWPSVDANIADQVFAALDSASEMVTAVQSERDDDGELHLAPE